MQDKPSFPWVAALVGVPLLLIWVVGCAVGYTLLLNRIGVSEGVLQWTTWPFTLLVLGVPIIVGVMFGGARLLRQAVEMKQFFEKMPGLLDQLGALSTAMRKAGDAAELASKRAQDAARAAGEAAVDVAVDAANAAQGGVKDQVAVDRFFAHYDSVKERFEAAMNKLGRWGDFPRYLQSDRDAALDALVQAKFMTERGSEYIKATIDLERGTRRTRRSTLESTDVDKLDTLAKSAGI